ncbi:hypothetical protein M441DRAFT_135741 [Trichoderma asperellum CBS 433.97]|uniref:Uncharacterized protein n=1 Tax=Trichoderma asperellum (strain ATCC 204424 / CBS 433.97 / NBRC 101777) TaxID=1042311 RepID=A0A2T3ZF16_TRIA4|nr:hypothetical protein M441DRAFT_135741 [Trichoderma asperellum CBS 433.97]PTB43396.1 hypothetical protein M441DRAFT_135741 [Trichoderma asperellum CBS 433.97]
MGKDTQGLKPTPLLGFSQTFGNQRTMADSIKPKDSQRPANDAGPNPKRRRTIDRPDERSPVAQRERVDASSPAVLAVPHRQRNPDVSKQHLLNALPKAATDHGSVDSLKSLMNLFSENFESFQMKNRAVRHLKRNTTIQDQNHHRPSDFSSALNLQAIERKAAQEDIERADKQITEFCNKISPVLRSILHGILEGGGMVANPSAISDKPVISEAKLNTVQDTIKREMKTSFKKDLAESQKSLKDGFESQMSKLKEELSHEYEQQFKSLKGKLIQEYEERENSLKKTLTQEGEERVKSLKKLLAQEHEKRITDIKHSVARENKEKISNLENALANENMKNAALEKKMADLETKLDKASSEQRQKLESLVNQTHLDQCLQRLSNSQGVKFDEMKAKLEERVNLLAGNSPRIETLVKDGRSHLEMIERKAGEFNARLTSLESMAPTASVEELVNIRTEMADIDKRIQTLSPKHESSPISTDSIRRAIWLEVEKEIENKANATKLTLARVQSGLNEFLKTEREEREALEVQCAEITRQFLLAQQEATAMKSKISELNERGNDPILQQDNILKWVEEKFNSRIGAAVIELHHALEGVYMQLQALTVWQNNFSTKGLYRDILNHINATMPDGTVTQLRSLKQRMEVAETRIAACENSVSNKRRKLPSGTSRIVTGDQADA